MEGTPFAVENTSEDDKEKEEKRKAVIKKPEALGILAVEPTPEKEPSALERVLAAIRPKAETEEKPDTKEEAPVILEAQPLVERLPEEDARHHIVREMVITEQEPEAENEEVPTSESEPTPKPKVEAEPVEAPEVPEAPAVEVPKPEPIAQPETKPPEIVEPPKQSVVEEEPTPVPEAASEIPAEPKTEVEPVIAPVPVIEKPKLVEKPEKPADDDKKPGGIRSLFRRRNKKTEKKPEPEIEEEKPKGPEFQFNKKITEAIEEKPETAVEEPETLPKPKPKPERIGQVLLNPEGVSERQARPTSEAAESSKAAEVKMNIESSPLEPISGTHVDTLSRGELMELGAKIEVNGNNLRHIYETHLIGERGLRRLIAEHLRGGDVAKALRREVMEHEIDFERDPIMRDHVPITSTPFDNNTSALDRLLEEADVSLADNSEQTAVYKAQARHQSASQDHQSHQRRLLDITLIATITFLVILILIIFLVQG